jgi:hypothetical protein
MIFPAFPALSLSLKSFFHYRYNSKTREVNIMIKLYVAVLSDNSQEKNSIDLSRHTGEGVVADIGTHPALG